MVLFDMPGRLIPWDGLLTRHIADHAIVAARI
jgi:hypothetical protein